jgi:hypothetical protein
MSGTISARFYFPDWLSDAGVRASSLAARGLWMDLLCIAAANKSKDHGFVIIGGRIPTVSGIARIVGSLELEVGPLLEELERNGVFSRDRRGAIYCRRMVRAEKNRGNGRLGGNPDFGSKPNQRTGLVPASLRSKRRNFSSEERNYIFNVSKGKCHWCKIDLVWDYPYKDQPPENFMHIDHLVPICDGGTNEITNLVGSCRVCNSNRSLTISSGNEIDSKNGPPLFAYPPIPVPVPKPVPVPEKERGIPTESSSSAKRPPPDDFPSDAFDLFWRAYPPGRKTGKASAQRKFDSIRKSRRVTFATMMLGLKRYVDARPEPQYTKAPEVWLNKGCWDDESYGGKSNGKAASELGFSGLAARARYGSAAEEPPEPTDHEPFNGR